MPLAVTMGEPAGIGGEILLSAWARRHEGKLPPFLAIDDIDRLAALAPDISLTPIADPAEAMRLFATSLPVLHRPLPARVAPGRPDPANARAVIGAIEEAAALALEGRIAGLVTNPIHKATLYGAGFAFPGHTEFLAHLAGGVPVVMMLASPQLKVIPVTIHLALKEAIAGLTSQAIIEAGRIAARALARDFALAKPRLAVAGLNPHAGEGGAMGTEEERIIRPAVLALQAQGIAADGPWPPDTMFAPQARARYDAALCMYHDQALIPLKALDFDGGVNVTLGLPFIRTSPDHGTAFDIAGSGRARPDSLMAAIALAGRMALNRAA